MPPATYTYNAFISYSQAADGLLAPALQSALHRLTKPWYRLRAVRVFRDRTNLSANPGLWSEILKALRQSEFLLLMASPSSVVLGVAFIATAVSAVTAYFQRNEALRHAMIATSRTLAIRAETATRDADLNLALLMSSQAYQMVDSFESRGALFQSVNACPTHFLLRRPGARDQAEGRIHGVALNSQGNLLASAGVGRKKRDILLLDKVKCPRSAPWENAQSPSSLRHSPVTRRISLFNTSKCSGSVGDGIKLKCS